jgi:hypothetical protein
MKLLWIINVEFNMTDEQLINSAFVKYLRKNWNTMGQCISYSEGVMGEVFYNILTELIHPPKSLG